MLESNVKFRDSEVFDAMDAVYALRLPIESEWSKDQQIATVIRYLNHSLALIDDRASSSTSQFLVSRSIKRLLLLRYREDLFRYLYLRERNEISLETFCLDCNRHLLKLMSTEESDESFESLMAAAQSLRDAVLRLIIDEHSENDFAIMKIKFCDFIEDLFDFLDPEV